jgi:TRAP-type mannitol/chloroaromatic compound transport system permease large subunit
VVILFAAFLLGFIIDLISIVLIVIPIAIPLVKGFGIDPLWFSVLFLIVLQTSYLSPPMAPSIFYLRAIAPPSITLKQMYIGVVPFIVCQLITLAIVVIFPDVAVWLPKWMYGN